MPKIKDLIGKKFKKLKVLEQLKEKTKSNKILYRCICDCGNEHIVSGDLLRSGKTKSCGCLKILYLPKTFNYNRKEQILIHLYNSTIKRRSKNRGWNNYIDFFNFKKLVLSNCHYCNSEPFSKISDRKKNKNKILRSDEFVYVNGIDRINSDLGYVLENVVPCCKYCNIAKNIMSDNEFKIWIEKIYEHYIKNNLNI